MAGAGALWQLIARTEGISIATCDCLIAKLRRINQEPATEVEEYIGMFGNEKRAWLISHRKFMVDINPTTPTDG